MPVDWALSERGGMRPVAGRAGRLDPEYPDGEWRLSSIGYNLGAAAVIGAVAILGTLFGVLEVIQNTRHLLLVLRGRRAPQFTCLEWQVDASDEDRAQDSAH